MPRTASCQGSSIPSKRQRTATRSVLTSGARLKSISKRCCPGATTSGAEAGGSTTACPSSATFCNSSRNSGGGAFLGFTFAARALASGVTNRKSWAARATLLIRTSSIKPGNGLQVFFPSTVRAVLPMAKSPSPLERSAARKPVPIRLAASSPGPIRVQ